MFDAETQVIEPCWKSDRLPSGTAYSSEVCPFREASPSSTMLPEVVVSSISRRCQQSAALFGRLTLERYQRVGAAQNAGRPNIDIGGHAALAYSGDGSLAWFVGFATFAGRQGAAVAIVLENSADPGLAADIGGTALAAAQAALAQPSP